MKLIVCCTYSQTNRIMELNRINIGIRKALSLTQGCHGHALHRLGTVLGSAHFDQGFLGQLDLLFNINPRKKNSPIFVKHSEIIVFAPPPPVEFSRYLFSLPKYGCFSFSVFLTVYRFLMNKFCNFFTVQS